MTTATVTRGISRWPWLLSSRVISLGAAEVLFIGICVLPLINMLIVSFTEVDGSFTFANYGRLLFEARQRELLINSASLGAATAFVATILGAPLGLLFARADLPAKSLLRLALIIPLVLPPYVLGLAWIYVSGSTGIAARLLGRDLLSSSTYSLAGAVVVLSIGFFPLAMLGTEAAARRVDGRLEEAGLLVANPRRVLTRITLPLIAPGVAAAALVIFVFALSEFGVPGLLRVRVFTTEVFTAFAAQYDFGRATALSVPLLLLALIAAVALKLAIGDRLLTTRRSLHTGLIFNLGSGRAPAIILLGMVLTLSVLLPLSALTFEAHGVGAIVAAVRSSGRAITNSIVLSLCGAFLTVALGLLLGYSRGRARTRFGRLADLVFIVLFAAPSTVIGVGLIGLWNRPGPFGEIYRSPLIIVIAYLARFGAVAALILAAAVRQVPASLEEAAEVAGAGWLRAFARIVFPQITAATTAALAVSFIFAFGELGATVLVAPPGESTLPVRVYTLIANAPSSQVASLALMQASIVLMPLILFGWFAHDRK
ncbi:MAG TPA: iron ABC transporter permease [Blastocatellia bacterium]|nr:iron ABC transporter permease [Blastocatellia bacterium]